MVKVVMEGRMLGKWERIRKRSRVVRGEGGRGVEEIRLGDAGLC
jgi:hypothetical protein